MHVVFSLDPGGMEYGVVKLVNALDGRRIQSSICSTVPGGRLKEQVKAGLPVYELSRRPGNDPRLVWQLQRLLCRARPDIVHTHGWGTLVEGYLASRLARVPAIVHGEHGTLQLQPHQRLVQRLVWRRLDRVLSVSLRLAERMARDTAFPQERIETIRNGVDLSRFGAVPRELARETLRVPADTLVVGTLGRLVAVKNQALLLDAFARMVTHHPNAMLMVAGHGPLERELRQRSAALDIEQRVRWLGHRADPDVVLAALDVFVLSSSSEGMPNTVLEAMATGLPVVCTRVGGADEVIVEGATGYLIEPGDPKALAGALTVLLTDPQRRIAMGRAGRARVEGQFSLEATVRQYESLYRRVLADADSSVGSRPGSL